MTNLRSLYPQPSTGGIEILSFTQIFELTMYVCIYVCAHTHTNMSVCRNISSLSERYYIYFLNGIGCSESSPRSAQKRR